MSTGTVSFELKSGVATVTFSHPKGNSLPGPTLQMLATTIRDAGTNPAAKIIVLRSDGNGAFCAGASFDELKSISTPQNGKDFFLGFAKVILAMKSCPRLILTRIQGKVVGGGVGLVAASDYTVAVESAALKLSELALGLGPFVIGPCVERKVGKSNFMSMALDADWRDASWAHTHGLYTHLVPDIEVLDREINKFTEKFLSYNPEAVAKLKNVLWEGCDDWDTLLESRAAVSGTLALSEFTKKAVAKG